MKVKTRTLPARSRFQPPEGMRGFAIATNSFLKTRQQKADYAVKLAALEVVAGDKAVCCAWCRDARVEVLELDHIEDDGHRHRKSLGRGGKGAGQRIYRWVVKNPDEARRQLQILCASDHRLKRVYGISRGQYEQLTWLFYEKYR